MVNGGFRLTTRVSMSIQGAAVIEPPTYTINDSS
jgi:hypothetical protein